MNSSNAEEAEIEQFYEDFHHFTDNGSKVKILSEQQPCPNKDTDFSIF